VAKWTTFPAQSDPFGIEDADVFPFADTSAADGSQQRVASYGVVRQRLNVVPIVSVAASAEPSDSWLGAHVRATAALTVTLPEDAPVGFGFTLGHQASAAQVSIAAGSGGATVVSIVGSITSTDPALLVDEFGAVMCSKVTSTVWEVYGALAEVGS
jgi:hypothetical protein